MRISNKIYLFFSFLVVFSLLLGTSAFAEQEPITREKLEEWEEQGIDPNHTEVSENLLEYVNEHLSDIFASMHIDRSERELGVLVFSFIEPVSEEHASAMKQLVSSPAEVELRQVQYKEAELNAKTAEIDLNQFQEAGISIYRVGPDVTHNRVEIAIEPYNEENARMIYDYYGSEMIHVVEGEQPMLLLTEQEIEESNTDEVGEVELKEEKSTISTFFSSIVDWFRNLFK
ncbi:hypothetical protein [Evansella cellulosilytica]|uniref:Uncharacterized protein n=1 Tax=Evansella cellulosilytica (strain ATCC 21833 / DSM 2522 / FERM P-1141 / JCM 9156 / N-4) TaxID=649639 RepID=E6TU91_EVAC2|nr:hypothetical protein [Evansella cellulosilytica]ADU28551.1 hypothetical protein Bcell_0264 [Evansella cellulosilytica DSM 2522]